MSIKGNQKSIAFAVIAYMLIALVWWSMLLHKKNTEAYQAKIELINIDPNNSIAGDIEEIKAKYERQEIMIIGEGLVFGIMLVIGIYLIMRTFTKELALAKKENNFLLSITHELKSPIASIQLILDTFKKRSLDKETFDDLNNNALEETSRLNALVGNLLFANKLNYGHDYLFEKTNLSALCKSVIEHYKKTFPQIGLSGKIDDEIYSEIDADAIGIVINNLIENAIKYSGKSPQIAVELSQNGQIELNVKDQGIGISDKDKKLIFSKFYRVGNEETRSTKGTGLGLYISQEIIKGHKGSISIHKNNPQGSVFKITIPNHDRKQK